ncbi:DEAD/DEAH box helicase [Amorphus coralli]|uniref:DEAD/DEAH box helicase n=1 Tax=Amorphus coralli TaxID=340680 RepID=UPI0003732AC8|nr:DEAD/DEAH box helicase [Amorphus coralli]
MTQFSDLGLHQPILAALEAERHVTPTPIQAQAIPPVMEGRDLLGIAQTGTGKTAAFALPILHYLATTKKSVRGRGARVLVLSPTRELCGQIQDRFEAYGSKMPLRTALVIGGVSIGRQKRDVERGVDVVIATPGRLLDLVEQRALYLSEVEVLVLDEADQMLDMGFIHSIKQIVAKLPKERQNLFFSATMPQAIAQFANNILTDPVEVAVTPVAKTADRVDQEVMFVNPAKKTDALVHVLKKDEVKHALVFTRTKHGADKVVKNLVRMGVPSEAIHGNKSQNQRDRTLTAFRKGSIRVLVATDIAARGIDVEAISHVVNYDLPHVPETYVHRIGRTARAGADGSAITICSPEDRSLLRQIERLIKQKVPVVAAPEGLAAPEGAGEGDAAPSGRNGKGRGQRSGNGGGRGAGGRTGGNRSEGGRQDGGRAEAKPNGEHQRGPRRHDDDGSAPQRRGGNRPAGKGKPQGRKRQDAGASGVGDVNFMQPKRPARGRPHRSSAAPAASQNR